MIKSSELVGSGRVDIYWRIFEANFNWLLSFKISQLETLNFINLLFSFILIHKRLTEDNKFNI